jgi:hypothetical protein
MISRKPKRDQADSEPAAGTPITLGDLIRRNRLLAQSSIDCLADMSDLPIAMVRRPEPAQLFETYRVKHSFFDRRFPSIDKFHEFILQANSQPLDTIAAISQNPEEWRPLFDDLYRDIFLTRPARAEPVIRLLRDHWTWKWVETLAIYDTLVHKDADQSSIQFYESFSAGIWLSALSQCADRSNYILLGPIKNKTGPVQELSRGLSDTVLSYYATCTEKLPPIHAMSRYEQFFHEKPSIYPKDLARLKEVVARSFDAIGSVVWPKDHMVDYFDITAVTEFTFLISELLHEDLQLKPKFNYNELSILYQYPSYLESTKREARQLLFQPTNSARKRNFIRITFKYANFGSPKMQKSLPRLVATARKGLTSIHDPNTHINSEFEKLFTRRRISQAQRLLEELLFLRNRLTDSFGVLTGSGHGHVGLYSEGVGIGQKIARAAAEVCNADAAVVYNYDHRRQILNAIGAYSDDPGRTPTLPEDYKWMANVGGEPESRKQSVAYAAVDQDQSVEYNESDEFRPLLFKYQTMAMPPPGSNLVAGKNLIVVPVKVFGRLWGVFEVISSRVNNFSYVHIEWLQKVADLVGPYYHEQLMINKLYEIASPSVKREPARTKEFDMLAERAADIFLTEAACIWVRDYLDSDKFECQGMIGRPDLLSFRESRPGELLSLDEKNSVAAQAIRGKTIWQAGEIGKPPFCGPWLEQEYTRRLQSLGFKYIAITPVYDLENKAIAVISIYTLRYPFVSNWESWAQYLSRYVGAVISRVHNAREDEWQDRRLVAHEIIQAIRPAQGAADKLATFMTTLPSSIRRPANLDLWISDIKTHLNDIDAGVAGWAGDDENGGPRKRETVLLADAMERAKIQPAPRLLFQQELNTCVESLRRDMRNKALDLRINYPNYPLALRMHHENLRMILNNLITNAVKYSPSGSTILCGFLEQPFSVRFFMKNLGPPLGEGDALRIFRFGFRGENAHKHKVRGSGLGLFIVKRLCSLYGVGVDYQPTPDHGRQRNVWHQFNLEFPRSMVDDGKLRG